MKLLRSIFLLTVSTCSYLFCDIAIASDPMNDVFELLETGGTRSGLNSVDGYYVVAIGTSSRSSENKAVEDARLDALKQLNEMINGINISGSSEVSTEYITVSENGVSSEFSHESFVDVVRTTFKDHLSAVKVLKKGKYDGDTFVALSISENDIKHAFKLKSKTNNPNGIDSSGRNDSNHSVASFSGQTRTIEAKGLASMKLGESKARKYAVNDAINNAVQQAQGVMLQGKSGRFNEAIAMAISTKTEGYVSSYDILEEDIARGSYYLIINAQVNAEKLLNDANFYIKVLGHPTFNILSKNENKTDWLADELERLGFSITASSASHTFLLKQSQREVVNAKKHIGFETNLSITLKDNSNGNILFTITNQPIKTRIFVKPVSRAKQVSEHVAYKQMNKKMGKEVIQSLADNAKKGVVYSVVIQNAKKTDVAIFKHVLNNGTEGQVESWDWDKQGKIMTLNYRFVGTLSEALDQGLDEIYGTFKTQGKGRRAHMKKAVSKKVIFEMVTK